MKASWWNGWSGSTANTISVRRPLGASCARPSSIITSANGCTKKLASIWRFVPSASSTSPIRRPMRWRSLRLAPKSAPDGSGIPSADAARKIAVEDAAVCRDRHSQQHAGKLFPGAGDEALGGSGEFPSAHAPGDIHTVGGIGRLFADSVAAVANHLLELGRLELCAAGYLTGLCGQCADGPLFFGRAHHTDSLEWYAPDCGGNRTGGNERPPSYRAIGCYPAWRQNVRAWTLLSIVVGCTVMSDLLSAFEMKRHGEIHDFRPGGIGRMLATLATKKFLILSIFFMAISFFAFMTLVERADLS